MKMIIIAFSLMLAHISWAQEIKLEDAKLQDILKAVEGTQQNFINFAEEHKFKEVDSDDLKDFREQIRFTLSTTFTVAAVILAIPFGLLGLGLNNLKGDFQTAKTEIRSDVQTIKGDMRRDIDIMREQMKSDSTDLRSQIKAITDK